jgi:hypothetical protein
MPATAAADLLADVVDELERDGTAAQLRAIAATLTPEEHERLAAEAATGDRLAELAAIPRTSPASTVVEGILVDPVREWTRDAIDYATMMWTEARALEDRLTKLLAQGVAIPADDLKAVRYWLLLNQGPWHRLVGMVDGLEAQGRRRPRKDVGA